MLYSHAGVNKFNKIIFAIVEQIYHLIVDSSRQSAVTQCLVDYMTYFNYLL